MALRKPIVLVSGEQQLLQSADVLSAGGINFGDDDLNLFKKAASYTPTWSGSGTPPAIGNGTASGNYTKLTGICFGRFEVQTGNTSTYGTGSTWTISLPVTSAGPNGACIGIIYGFNSGVAIYVGAVYQASSTTASFCSHNNGGSWGNANPANWGAAGSSYFKGMFNFNI